MKADKKDRFKKTIRLAADDKPTADFTDAVMKTIEADLQREAVLKTVLQRDEAVGPSFDFTARVMAGVKASKPAYTYKPIISRKAWYGIAAMITIFLTLISLSGPAQNTVSSSNPVAGLIKYTYAIPPVYIMSIAVAVIFLFADYLINRARQAASN